MNNIKTSGLLISSTLHPNSFRMHKWRHKSVVKLMEETASNDPIFEIRSIARNTILDAIQKGWSGPPFDSIELAKILGIELIPNDAVMDARISPKGKSGFVIEYNPFQKPTRINFSVAHEIAHTFFSDCSDQVRNREDNPNDNWELEKLCNMAAAELLLPYGVFSNDANELKVISLESLIELAKKYKASLESLFIRFVEVVDNPCAIMICYFDDDETLKIDYASTSRKFASLIPENFHIPKDSKAYECTAPGWTSRETVGWSFLNNKYDIYCIGLSPLRKTNKGRVGIIITPKEGNEDLQNSKVVLEFGDATKPRGNGVKIIAQVVNTSGGLGLGFGKSLSKNYPMVKDSLQTWHAKKVNFKLGNVQIIKVAADLYVCQMLAQQGLFGKGDQIPLQYPSLRNCLIKLASFAEEHKASVHMPMIGAGQAKGDWNFILGIIHDELIAKEIPVTIYMLPGKVPNIKTKSNLTLFKEESTWQKEK